MIAPDMIVSGTISNGTMSLQELEPLESKGQIATGAEFCCLVDAVQMAPNRQYDHEGRNV